MSWLKSCGNQRYCAVAANSAKFQDIAKVWVQGRWNTGGCDGRRGDGNVDLWSTGIRNKEELIEKYFSSLDVDGNTKNSVRMSWTLLPYESDDDVIQFVLAPAMVNDNEGGLDLKVICSSDEADMKRRFGTVDYHRWTKIYGKRRIDELGYTLCWGYSYISWGELLMLVFLGLGPYFYIWTLSKPVV